MTIDDLTALDSEFKKVMARIKAGMDQLDAILTTEPEPKYSYLIEACSECHKPGRFIDNCCPDCAPVVKRRIISAIRAACPESHIPKMIESGAAKLLCS